MSGITIKLLGDAMSLFYSIKAIYEKFLAICSAIGAIWIVVLMLVISYDVLGRVFFNHPLQGTPEIVANSIVAISFLQFAYVLAVGKHVRTTILYDALSERKQAVLDLLPFLAGAIIFFMLVNPSYIELYKSIKYGEFEGEGALRVPTWPTRLVIFIGYISMGIEFCFLIIDRVLFLAGKHKKSDAHFEEIAETKGTIGEEEEVYK